MDNTNKMLVDAELNVTVDKEKLNKLFGEIGNDIADSLSASLNNVLKKLATGIGYSLGGLEDGLIGALTKPIEITLNTDKAKSKIDELVKPLREVVAGLDKATNTATGNKKGKSDLSRDDQITKRDDLVSKFESTSRRIESLGGNLKNKLEGQLKDIENLFYNIAPPKEGELLTTAQVKRLDDALEKLVNIEKEIERINSVTKSNADFKLGSRGQLDEVEKDIFDIIKAIRQLGNDEVFVEAQSKKLFARLETLRNLDTEIKLLPAENVEEADALIKKFNGSLQDLTAAKKTLADQDLVSPATIKREVELRKETEKTTKAEEERNNLLSKSELVSHNASDSLKRLGVAVSSTGKKLQEFGLTEKNSNSLTNDLSKVIVSLGQDYALLDVELNKLIPDATKLEAILKRIGNDKDKFDAINDQLRNASSVPVATALTKQTGPPVLQSLPLAGISLGAKGIPKVIEDIRKYEGELDDLRKAIAASGVPLVDVVKKTSSFENALNTAKVALQRLDDQLRKNELSEDEANSKFKQINETLAKTKIAIEQVDGKKLLKDFDSDQVDRFGKGLVTNLAVLGFTLQRIGGQLQQFGQQTLQTFNQLATAADPIEKARNIIGKNFGDRLTLERQKELVNSLKDLADLPGNNLKDTTTQFLRFADAVGSTNTALKLTKGLISLSANTGVDKSNELTQILLDARTKDKGFNQDSFGKIQSLGGQNVQRILSGSGITSTDEANQFGVDNIIQLLAEELSKLETPLLTTADRFNALGNRVAELGEGVGKVLSPALADLNNFLKTEILPLAERLQHAFDGLTPSTQQFISYLALGIPVLAVIGGAFISLLGILSFVGSGFGQLTKLGTLALAKLGVEVKEGAGLVKTLATAFKGLFVTASGGFSIFNVLGGSLSGFATGMLKFLGVIPGLGTVINLILAYATNFGEFRDRVNSGVITLYNSITRLIDTFSQFGESGVGKVIFGFFGVLSDTLGALTGIIGSAISGILGLLGTVVDFVNDILGAFSQDSLRHAFGALVNAVVVFVLNALKTIGKFVVETVGTLGKLGSSLFKRLGFSTSVTDAIDAGIKSTDAFAKSIGDSSFKIKDGRLVLEAYTESQKEQKKAIDSTTESLNNQTKAFESLAVAAKEAATKAEKEEASQTVKDTENKINEIKTQVGYLGNNFKDKIKDIFNPAVLQPELDKFTAQLNGFVVQYNKLIDSLVLSQREASFSELKANPLVKAVKDALDSVSQSGLESQDLSLFFRQAFVDAKNVKDFGVVYKQYQEEVTRVKALLNPRDPTYAANLEVFEQLEVLDKLVTNSGQKIKGDLDARTAEFTKITKSALDQAGKEAQTRSDFLQKRAEDFQRDQALTDKEEEISKRKAELAKIDADREKFLITSAKARRDKLKIQLEIVGLETARDLEKLQAEIDKIQATSPDDTAGINNFQVQIANRKDKGTSEEKRVREESGEDGQKEFEKAKDLREKRLKEEATSIVGTLEPFQDQIVRLIGRSITGESVENLRKGFDDIIGTVKGKLPELTKLSGDIAVAVAGGDTTAVIKSFLNFKEQPLLREFEGDIRALNQRVQSIVLSSLKFDENNKLIDDGNISSFVRQAIGASDTKSDLSGAFSKADIVDRLTGNTENKSLDSLRDYLKVAKDLGDDLAITKGIVSTDIEDLLALLAKAKSTENDITNLTLNGDKNILGLITKAVEQIQTEKLDRDITAANRRIAEIDNRNDILQSQGKLSVDLDLKRKLLVQTITFETQRLDLKAQYAALDLAKDEKDAEAKKKIFLDLENERVRIKFEGQQRIRELQGGTTNIKPIDVPEGIAGAPEVKKTTPEESVELPTSERTLKIIDATKALRDQLDGVGNKAREAGNSILELFNRLASGEGVIGAFTDLIGGLPLNLENLSASFQELAVFGVAAFGDALGKAIADTIVNGGNFLKNLGKFFGDTLVALGTQLLSIGIAAAALATIGTLFPVLRPLTGGSEGFAGAAVATAVGLGLILAGKALGGGGGSKATASASNVGATNSANSSSGNSGQISYDPEKDPKLIYQKALQAQVYIDIKRDDGSIVKAVIKQANRNPRFARLMGTSSTSGFAL